MLKDEILMSEEFETSEDEFEEDDDWDDEDYFTNCDICDESLHADDLVDGICFDCQDFEEGKDPGPLTLQTIHTVSTEDFIDPTKRILG